MDLIDQKDLTVLVTAHLIFGIDENQAILGGLGLTESEKFLCDAATLFPILGRHPVLGHDLVRADRKVVVLVLDGRCEVISSGASGFSPGRRANQCHSSDADHSGRPSRGRCSWFR